MDLLNYSLSAVFVGSKLLPIERPDFVLSFARVCWVQNDHRGGPSRIRYYGLSPPWLEAEAGGGPLHHTREIDVLEWVRM